MFNGLFHVSFRCCAGGGGDGLASAFVVVDVCVCELFFQSGKTTVKR